MLGVKKPASASHSHKTLVRTAEQAFGITLLSSKGNVNHLDLHEKLFIILAHEILLFDWVSTCSV